MAKTVRWLAKTALFGLVLIGLIQANTLHAQTTYAIRPTCNGPKCIPNVETFGYFDTQWREWPRPVRIEQKLPRGVGAESMPPPPGQEPVPLPKATPLPSKGSAKSEGLPDFVFPVSPETKQPAAPKEKEVSPMPEKPTATPQPKSLEPESPIAPSPAGAPRDILPGPKTEPTPAKGDAPLPLPSIKPEPAVEKTEPMPAKSEPAPTKPSEKPADAPALIPEKPVMEGGLPGLPVPESPAAPKRPSATPAPGGLPGDPDLLPAEPKRPASPIPPGTLEPSKSGMKGAPRPINSRLEARWDSALYPESMGSGNLTLASFSSPASQATPPLVLNGFCPVQLCEHERWVAGDRRFAADYKGKTYLLSSAAAHDRFVTEPERYVPACSGNDPVLAAEKNIAAAGTIDHSAMWNGRLYLFSRSETLARFHEAPERYTEAITAHPGPRPDNNSDN